jgi:hypothetical protein
MVRILVDPGLPSMLRHGRCESVRESLCWDHYRRPEQRWDLTLEGLQFVDNHNIAAPATSMHYLPNECLDFSCEPLPLLLLLLRLSSASTDGCVVNRVYQL